MQTWSHLFVQLQNSNNFNVIQSLQYTDSTVQATYQQCAVCGIGSCLWETQTAQISETSMNMTWPRAPIASSPCTSNRRGGTGSVIPASVVLAS